MNYKRMMKNISVKERKNQTKYLIIYSYRNKDYNAFMDNVKKMVIYLQKLKKFPTAELEAAFSQLKKSLDQFRVLRNTVYEVKYFNENHEEMDEEEFNKNLDKKNKLDDIEID